MSVQLTKFIKGLLPILKEIGGERRRFQEDETILREGKLDDALFLIETGDVRIVWGDEQFEMAKCGPGEVLGELSYLEKIPHTATVIADSDCSILILPRKAMKNLARRSPALFAEFNAHLIHILADRFRHNAVMRHELQAQKKEISELTEKLQELDRLKSNFFANISHEFRTPLTLILGPVEQLLEKRSGDDRNKLALIRRNAKRLLQLVNQLLDLAKLESGGLKLRAGPGDFVAHLMGLVMSFESLANRKGIDLQVEVVHGRRPAGSVEAAPAQTTYFDREKVETIFINLLSNAFKFTPEGGTISVQISISHSPSPTHQLKAGYNAIITIRDTGEGIPSEHLPYVFDRFYQTGSASHRANGGSGIGLALVKELVELHFGSIAVTSEEGTGTTFTVWLPLGSEHLKPEEIVDTDTSHQSPVLSGPGTEDDFHTQTELVSDHEETADRPIILVIEDNVSLRGYIREQLQAEYAMLEAADGEAGVALAIETIPDLVISDVMMPKKDGYEVCRTLKTDERTSHIPVILLTAKAGEQERVAGLETGADAYVMKPFRHRELLARVRNLITLRRKLRQRYSTATVIKPSEVEANSMDRDFLSRVIAVIEANIGEEHFNADALAREAAMSVSQLNRKLNALIGQPAGQLIRSLRLQRAANLLAKRAGTVTEICYMVGFGEQANFTRAFIKHFGCSPSEYQKTHRE